ncbi:MAG: pitrilysin family protein [Polyangiaceae bacterium]
MASDLSSSETKKPSRVKTERAATPEGWKHLETIPFAGGTVERYELERNGLTVLFHRDTQAPVFSYHTWFRVGSRHEKPGKTGLAHLFEHLMFNETENLKAGEFDRKLEENGAESNAATWVDWTFYHASLPRERLGLVAKLESERMARLVLREPQVASEKDVVANERRQRVDDDIEGAASEVLYKLAFKKHPYGWPTIGWMEDIQGFEPSDCEVFYRTYYSPNNATVVICGDLRAQDVLSKLASHYGDIPRADIPAEDYQPEPPQTEGRFEVLRKPTSSPKLLLGFKGPALGDPEHTALTLLSEVLFGGRASRLHKLLVTEKECVSELRGWVSIFRDPGLFDMMFSVREGHTLEEVHALVNAELERTKSDLVTAAELERAKARLELGLLQTLDTANGRAEQIGFYETVLGDPAAPFRRLAAYRKTTPSDLRAAARRYLTTDACNVVHVISPDDDDEDDTPSTLKQTGDAS